MAAGCGAYWRKEFRVREVSRKKDCHRDRYRDGDRERSRGFDLRDPVKGRRRDAKARELLNGYHRSHRSASNSSHDSGGASSSGQKRIRLSRGSVEVEAGELSTGTVSDESSILQVRDSRIQKSKNTALFSPSKKRKFSAIAWDRDDGNKSGSVLVVLPPPPQLLQGYILPRSIEIAQQSTEQPPDLEVSVNTPQGQQWSDDREPGEIEVEDEESSPPRNIYASRWAVGDYGDEDAVPKSEEDPSPKLGEVISRDGSDSTLFKLLDSDGEHGYKHRDLDVDQNDYMVVEKKEDDDNFSNQLSATDPKSSDSRSMKEQGWRSIDEFEKLNKINEGTYGIVYRARDKKTGEIVALKKMKMKMEEHEGFPLTSLKEINILFSLQHRSIVGVKEVVVNRNLDSIFMVMEYLDHDLKALMEAMKQPFSQSEVKCLMLQLLEGVDCLHDNFVLHRDLRTSNLLLNNCGELKICDFGLSRWYGSLLKPYTLPVVTLWYRAPELLLGATEYSTAIDMWSVGCIMAELLAKEPLFNGNSELNQLDKIFRILGTPNETIWPGFAKLPGGKFNFVRQPYNKLREKFPPITSFSGRPILSETGFDLLSKLLTYDPDKRITAEDALNHAWFREVPLPKSKEFMPTFPAQNAQDRSQRRIMNSQILWKSSGGGN